MTKPTQQPKQHAKRGRTVIILRGGSPGRNKQKGATVKRDIEKLIKDYKKTFSSTKKKGAFYAQDYFQIMDISEAESHGKNIEWHAVFNALHAGFMIGYNCAKRESRKQAKRKEDKQA